jgi:hypothetical protein
MRKDKMPQGRNEYNRASWLCLLENSELCKSSARDQCHACIHYFQVGLGCTYARNASIAEPCSLAESNNSINRLTSGSLAGFALAISLVAALVALALSLGVEAVVRVSSLVAQVGVDADELAAILGNDTAHVDLA